MPRAPGREQYRGCLIGLAMGYLRTVRRAIAQGNDTDTIAAMAGALSGTRLGIGAIPESLRAKLEDGHKGRSYVEALADRLFDRNRLRPDSYLPA